MTNEEAIDVLKNDIEICTIQQKQACDMAIKALEQTELNPSYNSVKSELEQTTWIPVSELPKKSGEYLLDSEDFGIYVGDYDADMKSFGWWRDDYDYDTLACIDREFIKFEGILAWMPLPQPYRESEE